MLSDISSGVGGEASVVRLKEFTIRICAAVPHFCTVTPLWLSSCRFGAFVHPSSSRPTMSNHLRIRGTAMRPADEDGIRQPAFAICGLAIVLFIPLAKKQGRSLDGKLQT